MMWVFAFFVLLDTRQPLLITLAIVVALIAHAIMAKALRPLLP